MLATPPVMAGTGELVGEGLGELVGDGEGLVQKTRKSMELLETALVQAPSEVVISIIPAAQLAFLNKCRV